jgi:hypothetical protein
MRWTQIAGAAAVLVALPGCAVWLESRTPVPASYAVGARPVPSYYCYDCHGDRYLDPYYDWCAGHGFRYAWDRHPEAIRVYRERYVRIKEQNPSYGRYRYPAEYRGQRRYQEPTDYDSWRRGTGSDRPSGPDRLKVREKGRHEPGDKRTKRKSWDRERPPADEPRNARPDGGRRPGPPGGA